MENEQCREAAPFSKNEIEILPLMNEWRDGCLSDVEALLQLMMALPASPATDAVIEVVGKMYQEEVAEWPEPNDREELATLIHGDEE